MDIGLVIYDELDTVSGGYRYDRKLVEYLRNCGDTVDVISLPHRPYHRCLCDGIRRSLRLQLDRPYDVLLQDELCHPSLLGHNEFLTAPDAVLSLVHHFRFAESRGVRRKLYRAFEHRYINSIDGAVCTSRSTKATVDEMVSKPAMVAYPGGRCSGAALTGNEVSDRSYEQPLRIAFVGALTDRKNVETLLDAVADLSGSWHLDIVGSLQRDTKYTQRILRRLSTEDPSGVHLHGEVSNEQLERIFERSHMLVVPSLYEGFGMVYLEAMEFGVVPIATSRGGPSELIEHGVNGYLVDPLDASGIRRHIVQLRDNRSLLERMALQALETADAHPDWSASMAGVRDFLQACCNDFPAGLPTQCTDHTMSSMGGQLE